MERNTRQRSAIRDAIARADRPLLPQEVLEAAQHDVHKHKHTHRHRS
jgi:Fur family ferric uptake transcriptional regulator